MSVLSPSRAYLWGACDPGCAATREKTQSCAVKGYSYHLSRKLDVGLLSLWVTVRPHWPPSLLQRELVQRASPPAAARRLLPLPCPCIVPCQAESSLPAPMGTGVGKSGP